MAGCYPPGSPGCLGAGETVLLLDRKNRRYLITLREGESFHFHGGEVRHNDVLNRPEGSRVESSKGETLLVLRPTMGEWSEEVPHSTQIIFPKDQAVILHLADVHPAARVVEAGAGSGILSVALLRLLGSEGRLTSFELRSDHAASARNNVERFFGSIPDRWELRVEDVVEGLGDLECGRLLLDLPEPWRVLAPATESLRPGGILLSLLPTVNQVMQLRESLWGRAEWGCERTMEVFLRSWKVSRQSVRPVNRMVAHTGFLTVTRRLA